MKAIAPKKHDGTESGDRREDWQPPSGDHMVAITWFKRRVGGNDKEFLKVRIEMCSDEFRDKSFFTVMSLDTDHPQCSKRWEILMEAVGVDHQVDLDSDKEISDAFRAKPFKAKLGTSVKNGYRNTELERIIYASRLTEIDVKVGEAWREKWKEGAWKAGERSGGRGRASNERIPLPDDEQGPQWSEDSPFRDDGGADPLGLPDDDIPF